MCRTWSRQVPGLGGFMFVALRQKAGIWLPKEQRLPHWGDAETQHVSAPPSFLAPGTALLMPVFSAPLPTPARVRLSEPGLLLSLLPWLCLSQACWLLLLSPSLPVCWWGRGVKAGRKVLKEGRPEI